jgi:hypothetical protein
MPHDCKGREVGVGDVVLIYAKVKEVFQSETACNFSCQVLDPNEPPLGEYLPTLTFNTRVAEVAMPAPVARGRLVPPSA